MDRAWALAVVTLLVTLATLAVAHGGPCDPALGRAFVGPPELGVATQGLGAPRSPCVERAVFLRFPAAAVIDVPDFYGTISAGGLLGLRWHHARRRAEVSLEMPVTWTFAQNASLVATETTVGPVIFGIARAYGLRVAGLPLALLATMRVAVSGSALGRDDDTGFVELGVHGGARPLPWLTTDARVIVVSGPQVLGSAGAGVTLGDHLALHLGAELAAGARDRGVDHALVRSALRFGAGTVGAFELALALPLAGEDRHDGWLLLGWHRAL